jgi:hypothetical protein
MLSDPFTLLDNFALNWNSFPLISEVGSCINNVTGYTVSYLGMQFHTCVCSFIHVYAVSYMCMQFHTCVCSFIHVYAVSYLCIQSHTWAWSFIHVYAVSYMCMQKIVPT